MPSHITVRPLTPQDKAAVVDISSRIWEGEDYVAQVFDEWVADRTGEFAAVYVDDTIAGFGKLTMLEPGQAWLEGLRVDPNKRGLGLGKRLTEYFLERCQQLNCSAIRLATFEENVESIHILHKYGFIRIAEFLVLYHYLHHNDGQAISQVTTITDAQLVWQALDQHQLKVRKGFVSFDWIFQPLTYDLLEQLAAENSIYGIVSPQGVEAFVILSTRHSRYQTLSISYIQGEQHYAELLNFALQYACSQGYQSVMTMCPADKKLSQALLAKGFESFNDSETNVFLYEHESTLK